MKKKTEPTIVNAKLIFPLVIRSFYYYSYARVGDFINDELLYWIDKFNDELIILLKDIIEINKLIYETNFYLNCYCDLSLD